MIEETIKMLHVRTSAMVWTVVDSEWHPIINVNCTKIIERDRKGKSNKKWLRWFNLVLLWTPLDTRRWNSGARTCRKWNARHIIRVVDVSLKTCYRLTNFKRLDCRGLCLYVKLCMRTRVTLWRLERAASLLCSSWFNGRTNIELVLVDSHSHSAFARARHEIWKLVDADNCPNDEKNRTNGRAKKS